MEENIKLVENKRICAECKGQCCKGFGCHAAPSDVFKGEEPTVEALRAYMATKNFTIDHWEGDPRFEQDIDELDRVFFIRARNRNEGYVSHFMSFGPCALLTSKGCKLSFEERPTGGKSLVPSEDHHCKVTYSKEQCCIDWIPYQSIIEEVLEEVYSWERPVDVEVRPTYAVEEPQEEEEVVETSFLKVIINKLFKRNSN